MAGDERLRLPEIDDDEGPRLARIIRRAAVAGDLAVGADAAAAAQLDAPVIAMVAFTSEDRFPDVVGNFNADGSRFPVPK